MFESSDTTVAAGPIELANVTVGEFTVTNQAFSTWNIFFSPQSLY